jgi:hypothetical protein
MQSINQYSYNNEITSDMNRNTLRQPIKDGGSLPGRRRADVATPMAQANVFNLHAGSGSYPLP